VKGPIVLMTTVGRCRPISVACASTDTATTVRLPPGATAANRALSRPTNTTDTFCAARAATMARPLRPVAPSTQTSPASPSPALTAAR